MPLKDDALQGQLERAKAALGRAEAVLDGQVPKKNPAWRKANSRVKQIEERVTSREKLGNAHAAPTEAE